MYFSSNAVSELYNACHFVSAAIDVPFRLVAQVVLFIAFHDIE